MTDRHFCFAALPFALLKDILELAMTKLENGPLVQELKQKGVQVFINYCAGGPDKQIALEQQANAASNGLLNVAARNAMGVAEVAGVAQEQQQLPLTREEEQERTLLLKEMGKQAQVIATLPGSLEKASEQYSIFSETRIKYARLEAEQERELAEKAAEQKRLLDEKAAEQKLALAAKEVEHEGLMQRMKRKFEAEGQCHELVLKLVRRGVDEGKIDLRDMLKMQKELVAMNDDGGNPAALPSTGMAGVPSDNAVPPNDAVMEVAAPNPPGSSSSVAPLPSAPVLAVPSIAMEQGSAPDEDSSEMESESDNDSAPHPTQNVPFEYDASVEQRMAPMQAKKHRLLWECLSAMYLHGTNFRDILAYRVWSVFAPHTLQEDTYAKLVDDRIQE